MKAALILLGGTFVLLAGLALWRGVFWDGMRGSGRTFLSLIPMLFLAFMLAGFAEALMPPGLVERWLSDAAGWRGIGVAWVAGAITPAGGLMGLPLAAGMLKAGAGSGVLVTYLASLALLPLLRMPMEVGIYGGKLAALRVAACLLLPPVAGVIAMGITRIFQLRL